MVKIFRQKEKRNVIEKIIFNWLLLSVFVFCFAKVSSAQSLRDSNATENVKEQEAKTMDLLSRIDIFTEEDERLKMDAAKAHYNMGNVYFQKGEYEVAAREYYQAVILMPNDPDVHYNLAYVSSEQLEDYDTALEHYKMYLYLKPNARDLQYVRHKILESELKIRGRIDSPLEKDKNYYK